MGKLIDLKGKRFGRLVVLNWAGSNKFKKATWLCKCDCGNEKIIIGSKLLIGETQSCGCYGHEQRIIGARKVQTKHGQKYTRLYNIWHNIKQRCSNKNDINYKYYGERGICVCDEWKNGFESFYKWSMENGYSKELTIDRIDNNKNYCPENCRWATYKQQGNNRRNNVFLTYKNMTKTISEWSEYCNISSNCIGYRILKGWDIEKILTTPSRIKKRRKVYEM